MKNLFKPLQNSDYECTTWFERDRAHIQLATPNGRTVFELWDDDLHQAIEDGFLTAPKHPRPSNADWQPHAVAYAKKKGLL